MPGVRSAYRHWGRPGKCCGNHELTYVSQLLDLNVFLNVQRQPNPAQVSRSCLGQLRKSREPVPSVFFPTSRCAQNIQDPHMLIAVKVIAKFLLHWDIAIRKLLLFLSFFFFFLQLSWDRMHVLSIGLEGETKQKLNKPHLDSILNNIISLVNKPKNNFPGC